MSTEPGRAIDVSREATLTVGPKTSPRRETTSPYATPARTSGNLSSGSEPRAVMISAASAACATSSATKSTSSPMFLITRPPWSTTSPEHSASKYSSHSTSSVSSSSLLREVKPTMSTKATASLRGVGPGRVAGHQPHAGAGQVAAPDVVLQRLDPRQHLGGEVGDLLDGVGALEGDVGEQPGLPLGQPGEAAAPGAHQGGLPVGAEDAELDQVVGVLERLDVGLRERHRVVRLVGEAEQPPQLLRHLERYAGLLADLEPGQRRGVAEEVPLDGVERLREVDFVVVSHLRTSAGTARPRSSPGPRGTTASRRSAGPAAPW